jgi:hypothetical protein
VHVRVRVCVYKCRNAELSGIPSEKTNDAGSGLVPDQVRQSGIFLVRYRTGIIDAGMPMPALASLMPMPRYEISIVFAVYEDNGSWGEISSFVSRSL